MFTKHYGKFNTHLDGAEMAHITINTANFFVVVVFSICFSMLSIIITNHCSTSLLHLYKTPKIPLDTAQLNCSAFLRGVVGNEFGRFGTSLAAIKDLNGDGLEELAVGAPQEEKGKGAIYIFLGQPGGIRTEYSQVGDCFK